MWKSITDFKFDTLDSTKYYKLREVWLNESSTDGLVAQGSYAKGFATGATATSDTTASKNNSCSPWGGREKWEPLEKHLSVCLISSSTSLLSPAGLKQEANGSQPKLCHEEQIKKQENCGLLFFNGLFIIQFSMCTFCRVFLLWKSSLSKVSDKQRRFTCLETERLNNSWEFCVKGMIFLNTSIWDLNKIIRDVELLGYKLISVGLLCMKPLLRRKILEDW